MLGENLKLFSFYSFSMFLIYAHWLLSKRFSGFFSSILVDFSLYFIIPFSIASLMKLNVGLSIGKKDGYKYALLLLLLSLPLSYYASNLREFDDYYPIFYFRTWNEFILREIALTLSFFACEAFYRGILLFPLAKKNETLAILLQNVPYTLLHTGKPFLEIPYAFVAGVVFCKIDLKSESFLPSFLLHYTGSLIFDIFCA